MGLSLSNSGLIQTKAFINGEWVASNSGAEFPIFNPANGETIAQVTNVGELEAKDAIEAAQASMQEWKVKSPAERSNVLQRWHDLIIDNADELASILTLEQGKPLAEAKGEILYGASYLKWFAEEAKRIYGDILPSAQDRRSLVIKQPVGVVAAITPWNFPNAMITRKVAPALAAGCSIVLKPAPETPLSALALAELADRAGVPAGVFNVLPCLNAEEVGEVFTDSTIVKKLTFTGSTPVGKLLLRQCADTVKRTSMELGGNAPVVVFDDADIDLAVAGAIASKFRNSGQTCICANRLLVQEGIYDRFLAKFIDAIKVFRLGDGFDKDTTLGPVITDKALAGIDTVVKDALDQGARLVIGGKSSDLDGWFYEPTVLADVKPDMDIFNKEIFGPVAPVIKFKTDADAIAMANDTSFGLASYIYTQDISRIWQVSEALEYGMVGVNETAISSELIPFGGVKESGHGREGSKYGLDDYLETKYICMGGLNA
ncbi:NAD-dependent succinate-semialdehyde dehydrogenase [Neptuniibacter sp. QD34_54]|uniref:NAD-dependent succinate-semialdehyde dehydrogenase n=1 Tax=Neptuniibacter sp. QD34_54 TaxID=3398208 RepID=UPI0039F44BB5